MKKYKLIKSYIDCDYNLGQTINTPFIWGKNGKKIHLKDYPENWEEVVEKNYEILSFKREPSEKFGDNLFKIRDKDGFYTWDFTNTKDTEEDLIKRGFLIHSVKRLSDSEIFTVGDKVVRSFEVHDIITKFELNNRLFIFFKNGSPNHIGNIKHIKKPLFTTEDGVDIFEGDEYHPILFNSFDYKGKFVAQSLDKGNNWTNPCSCKTFSTKEAANEYIILNYPGLSINDIMDPKDESNKEALGEFKNIILERLKNV